MLFIISGNINKELKLYKEETQKYVNELKEKEIKQHKSMIDALKHICNVNGNDKENVEL